MAYNRSAKRKLTRRSDTYCEMASALMLRIRDQVASCLGPALWAENDIVREQGISTRLVDVWKASTGLTELSDY